MYLNCLLKPRIIQSKISLCISLLFSVILKINLMNSERSSSKKRLSDKVIFKVVIFGCWWQNCMIRQQDVQHDISIASPTFQIHLRVGKILVCNHKIFFRSRFRFWFYFWAIQISRDQIGRRLGTSYDINTPFEF